MKYQLLFLSLCIIFYACSNSGIEQDNSVGDTNSSSSSLLSSSSGGKPPYCKTEILPKELWQLDGEMLYFDARGKDSSLASSVVAIREINSVPDAECEYILTEDDYCEDNYCYRYPEGVSVMKKECSWYSVTVIGENSLLVSVGKNETGEERVSEYISIDIASGCVSVGVKFSITQSAY